MNHYTDGNLAAIESHLNAQEDNLDTEDIQLASMTDEEIEELYWNNPEAMTDKEQDND